MIQSKGAMISWCQLVVSSINYVSGAAGPIFCQTSRIFPMRITLLICPVAPCCCCCWSIQHQWHLRQCHTPGLQWSIYSHSLPTSIYTRVNLKLWTLWSAWILFHESVKNDMNHGDFERTFFFGSSHLTISC